MILALTSTLTLTRPPPLSHPHPHPHLTHSSLSLHPHPHPNPNPHQAASVPARLEWMAQLESHLGMQHLLLITHYALLITDFSPTHAAGAGRTGAGRGVAQRTAQGDGEPGRRCGAAAYNARPLTRTLALTLTPSLTPTLALAPTLTLTLTLALALALTLTLTLTLAP
eukprot:scaffold86858_cov35-Phaeocystis_antarctica.AAC.1